MILLCFVYPCGKPKSSLIHRFAMALLLHGTAIHAIPAAPGLRAARSPRPRGGRAEGLVGRVPQLAGDLTMVRRGDGSKGKRPGVASDLIWKYLGFLHGLLENTLLMDDFFLLNPQFRVDFPAWQVWLPEGNQYESIEHQDFTKKKEQVYIIYLISATEMEAHERDSAEF